MRKCKYKVGDWIKIIKRPDDRDYLKVGMNYQIVEIEDCESGVISLPFSCRKCNNDFWSLLVKVDDGLPSATCHVEYQKVESPQELLKKA